MPPPHEALGEMPLKTHTAPGPGAGDDKAPAPLRDDPGALEHGQEAAGGLTRGAGQLRKVGLGGGDQHVGGALPGGHFLGGELAQHRRDTALDGLKGLAREALVHLAQAPPERDHQARGDLRVLAHQPAHVRAEHRHYAHQLDRLDGGRAQLILKHGKLAEDVAGPEAGERDRAPVVVRAHRARMPLAHDVARVAGVALAKDRLTGLGKPRGTASSAIRCRSAGSSVEKTGTRPSSSTTSTELAAAIAQWIPHRGGSRRCARRYRHVDARLQTRDSGGGRPGRALRLHPPWPRRPALRRRQANRRRANRQKKSP